MSNQDSGSGYRYEIPSLNNNRSNYNDWKFKVSTLLKIKSLIEIVKGTEKYPPEIAADLKDQVTVTVTFDKWQAQNDQAFEKIIIILKKELFRKIRCFELVSEV